MQVHPRHRLQFPSPRYETAMGGGAGNRIDAVLSEIPASERRFNTSGVRAFSIGQVTETTTCFENVQRIFPLAQLPQDPNSFKTLKQSLIESLEEILCHDNDPVIALSGGIDSFLLARLLKEVLGHPPRTATLITKLTDYCEGETTLRLAEEMGLGEPVTIEVDEEAFIANLPRVISACETPLYNLHPVSKWLFAQGLQEKGFSSCITGDGADQVAAGHFAYDYLPLLPTLFQTHGIDLFCPFTATETMKAIRADGSDPQKKVIRRLAEKHLPVEFAQDNKRPCFAPPMDLSRYQNPGSFKRLPESLGISIPQGPDDRERTFWTTLELLEQSHLN